MNAHHTHLDCDSLGSLITVISKHLGGGER